MSDVVSKRRLQLRALTAATAIALSTMVLSPAMAQGRVNLSGLQSTEQQGFQRFIVKYRDGSTKATSDASLTQSLSGIARAVPSAQGAALGCGTCAAPRWVRMWWWPAASWTAPTPRR